MSNGRVEFEEDSFNYSGKSRYPQFSGNNSGGGDNEYRNESRMVRFLIRHGFAKTPTGAQAILVIFIALNTILAFIVFRYSS